MTDTVTTMQYESDSQLYAKIHLRMRSYFQKQLDVFLADKTISNRIKKRKLVGLIRETANLYMLDLNVHRIENNNNRTSLGSAEKAELINVLFNVVYDFDENDNITNFYIYDPLIHLYRDDEQYVKTILSAMSKKSAKNDYTELAIKQTIDKLLEFSDVIDYNERNQPPIYLIKTNDGVFNWKTKKFYTNDDAELFKKYHFTKRLSVNVAQFFNNKNTVANDYFNILDQIFDDWSANDSRNKLFLMEICQSVFKGDSMKRSVLIQSDGGDGKSTFIEMLTNVTGTVGYVTLNAHKLNDDNMVNRISSRTHLIAGDDLASYHKLSGDALTRFKSIVSQKPIAVNRKFKSAIDIMTTALMLQATNTDMDFSENNNSIFRRLLKYNWPHAFKKMLDCDLDALITDSVFLSAFVYYIFTHCDYVTTWSNADYFAGQAQTMVDSNDIYEQMLDEFETIGMLDNDRIPIQALYQAAVKYYSKSGYSMKPTSQMFSKKIIPYLIKRGFVYDANDKKRFATVSYDVFNKLLYDNYIDETLDCKAPYRYVTKPNNELTTAEIDSVRDRITELSDSDLENNTRLIRILSYLAHDELNSFAIALLGV